MSIIDDIQNALKSFGSSSLGLAGPALSPQWLSGSNPTFNSASLTLTFAGNWKSPINGILDYSNTGAPELSGLDGNSIMGNVAVLRFHPHAVLRLQSLYAGRYGASNGWSLRPVPQSLVIRLASYPASPQVAGLIEAGGDLPLGEVSFHDSRGLIIDPLAVASAFADLIKTYPAMKPPTLPASPDLDTVLSADGGLKKIAGLDTAGVYLHFVTPHGAPWQDPGSGKGLQIIVSGGNNQRIDGAGPFSLPGGAHLDKESAAADTLRWGLATNAVLNTTAFSPPAFAGGTPANALARDFLRICAVDLAYFLYGNRTANTLNGVGPADAKTVAEPAPKVRDGSHITYLLDGVDLYGGMSELLTGVSEAYLASPAIDDQFAIPAHPNERWPQFPTAAGTAGAWDTTLAQHLRTDGITVAWSNSPGSKDLVLTIADGLAPAFSHVRVYPRKFITQDSLANGPSFARADGAAVIAPASGATVLLLKDPLNLGTLPRPADQTNLYFDLLIAPRPPDVAPRERLFGGLSIPITGPDVAPPPAPTATNGMTSVANDHRALCSAPVLGVPARSGIDLSNLDWSNLLDLVRRFASEGTPREGPRFPTMARSDSLAAFRSGNSPSVTWTGLLSGAFFTSDSLMAGYRLGNPGHTAGAEIHATGVRVDGQLGYDLGIAALRRSTNLVDRLVTLDADNWNEPAAPTSPGTQAGAVLQTVAPYCETPELTLISNPASLPATWNDLKNAVTSALGGNSSVSSFLNKLSSVNPLHNPDRLVAEFKREAFVSNNGRRDAQWAIRRAISEARELIYLEAPCFQKTALTTDAFAWDLVQALVDRLQSQPNLKVILSLSKEIAFGPAYASWAKQGYDGRVTAVNALQAVDGPAPDSDPGAILNTRLAVFHPIGFPGRPLNVRSTVMIVDDVWCLVGTSAPRRRGFTFDGAADLVSFDRQLFNGYSSAIREFRRNLMALHLGVSAPASGETPAAGWVRLAQPASAFAVFKETLQQGGRALIEPLWKGMPDPSDGGPTPQSNDVADPEGRSISALLLALASLISGLEGPAA